MKTPYQNETTYQTATRYTNTYLYLILPTVFILLNFEGFLVAFAATLGTILIPTIIYLIIVDGDRLSKAGQVLYWSALLSSILSMGVS
jgi:hypothetical protein